MIHILLFLAMGVGLQSSVPTSTGIQQTDTHGPCVGDGCGHPYYLCISMGPNPSTPKHAEKDELPDPTKLDMCMMDHGPYGCEEFGGPPRDNSYSYKNYVMANGSVWIQKDCGVDPIAPVVSNGAITVDGGDGSKVIKITDEEYSHLQEIRQAVGDEEKRLAAKYGANLDDYALQTFPNLSTYPEAIHYADHFEFHGRFLIIDKSK